MKPFDFVALISFPMIASMEINGNDVAPPNPQLQPANLKVIGGDAPVAAANAVNAAGDVDEPATLAFGAKRPLKSDVWPHFTRFL
ncbi:hypothetical protein LINGRAHAP2_LOCUS15321 [Linum grandiflorum]